MAVGSWIRPPPVRPLPYPTFPRGGDSNAVSDKVWQRGRSDAVAAGRGCVVIREYFQAAWSKAGETASLGPDDEKFDIEFEFEVRKKI